MQFYGPMMIFAGFFKFGTSYAIALEVNNYWLVIIMVS